MNSELRMRVVPDLRFLCAGDGTPDRIQAKALVYGAVSEDMGGWREVFAPASVELDPDLRMLFDHQTSHGHRSPERRHPGRHGRRLGHRGDRLPAGHAAGRATCASRWSRGDINQMSFRFMALEDDIAWVPSEAAPDGGYVLRTVLRALVIGGLRRGHPGLPANVALARASVSGELPSARLGGAAGRAARGQGALRGEHRRSHPDPRPRRDRAQRRRPELGRRRQVACEATDDGDANDTGRRGQPQQTLEVTAGGRRSAGRPVPRRFGARQPTCVFCRGRVHDRSKGAGRNGSTTASWTGAPARSAPRPRRCSPRAPR